MHRLLLALCLAGAASACREYDNYAPLRSQKGLMDADRFAAYGHQQALAVAIGREFGATGRADAAAAYARSLPDVADVQTDEAGHRITVRFTNGWITAILPIKDGKRAADTKIPA